MQWFKDMKVGKKLVVSFLLLAFLTAVVGYLGVANMGKINDMADRIYENELLGVSYIKEANISLVYLDRAMKNLLLSSTKEDRDKYSGLIKGFEEMYRSNLEKARPLFYTEKGKEMLGKLDRAMGDFRPIMTRIIDLAKADQLQENRESVELSMGVGREKIDVVDETLTGLTKLKEENAQTFSEETTEIYESSKLLLIGIAAGCVVLGVALGMFIARLISAPLIKGVQFAQGLAVGDLEQNLDIYQKDEVGLMADALRSIAGAETQVSDLTASIAVGKLDMDLRERSPKDRLMRSLASMVAAERQVAGVAGNLAKGDLEVEIVTRSGDDSLMHAPQGDGRQAARGGGRGCLRLRECGFRFAGAGGLFRGPVPGRHGAGGERGGGFFVHGGDELEHPPERGKRLPDREDRAQGRGRRGPGRRGRGPDRLGHARHRQQDHDHRGDRPPDQPPGPERGHRGGPGR